jgi:hypothetical protein
MTRQAFSGRRASEAPETHRALSEPRETVQ